MIRVAPDGTLRLGTTAQILVEPRLVDHPVELRYSTADPFAVTLCFLPGRDATRGITWRLDREALRSGHAPGALCGDVRVTRLEALDLVIVELVPGTIAATVVRFPADEVDQFLAAAYDTVPRGDESLDVDGLITRILGAA